jgi:signal transduction histidine kinase/CheY-like chemotaxis protein
VASSKAKEGKAPSTPLGTSSASARGAGRLAIFANMFLPPPQFEPALEAEFREESLRRWTTARNAAVALLALVWVSYFGWDYFHGYRNQDFRPALDWIFPLRAAGTLCIAAAALTLYLRGTRHGAVMGALSACGCALYLLSLAMIAVAPFPYNYLFYYICLPMMLMFLFGLFRLPSRLVYALTLFCLVASFAFLTFTQTTETVAPKNLLDYMSKSLSYYNLAALIYLFSFSVIGCAVAVELERTARAAFTRERALTDRNARLETAQRETRAKTAALVKAKDELRALAEQQNVAKSKFLADAAHDLRQPMQAMTNLLGAARHALGQGDAAKADEVLALAQDASRLTRNSFNAVLDISRLESGFVEAEPADFDLPALIEETAALCDADAQERGVSLRLRWRRDRPIVVRSDRHLLGRVIGNLLANAIKYSDPAKGERSAVILGIVRLPSRVRIDIVDNGVGIAEVDWARVFRPFVQLGNDERDREKGVGLGLSIVNAIIPLLGEHRLDMRSTAGSGTRFSLELPYGAAPPEGAQRETTAVPGAFDISGLYVLYVEDDALVRTSALALFDTLGLRYEAYGSVAELEAGLPAMERTPDLLITDYRLPDGRTAEDVVRLTTAVFEAPLPLIVVTGEMRIPDGDWLGRGRILRKPVAPETLTAEIATTCATP